MNDCLLVRSKSDGWMYTERCREVQNGNPGLIYWLALEGPKWEFQSSPKVADGGDRPPQEFRNHETTTVELYDLRSGSLYVLADFVSGKKPCPAGATPAGSLQGCIDFFNNYNTQAVNNGAPRPAFTIKPTDPSLLCRLETYHWNNGQGKAPGAIGLLNKTTGVQYGPYPAVGKPGQGGVQNVNWEHDLTPRIELKPGDYEVIDSDPASWSWNSTSLDKAPTPKPAGFAKVWLANAN
jgi:hypothetical protein